MAYNFLDKAGVTWLISKFKTSLDAKQDILSDATSSVSGKMSASDKAKLDTITQGATAVTKTSDITNDSGFITISSVPTASSTAPEMDGTAVVGTSTTYARADHVHPTDTTRAAASAVTTLQNTVNNKVDKVSGMGLSTNDYTTAEKTKLAGLENYDDSEIRSLISSLSGIEFKIVESLPTTGKIGIIYLVAHSHGTNDSYDEYVWLEESSKFEKIGNTDVDLSDYVKSSDLVAITTTELSAIWTENYGS